MNEMNIHDAIEFLRARGFWVKGYGLPEADDGASNFYADSYRVIQGDFDTGMIEPLQLLDMARKIKEH